MSGFGGFGTGSTGGGLFGDKPPEQGSGGFTLPSTTSATTTQGLTFGTSTLPTNLFNTQQQSTAFGTVLGSRPTQTGSGFTFGSPVVSTCSATTGSTTTSAITPSLGASTVPAFGAGSAITTAAATSSNTLASTPAFGTIFTNTNVSKTTGVTGFTTTTAGITAPSTFSFGLPQTSAKSAPLTFGVPTAAVAATTPATVTSAAPTLTFGVATTSATTTSGQSTGFNLGQPITTASLTFGVPKTTKDLTFGSATTTFNVAAATTASTSLGTSLFGTPKTTDSTPGTTTTTTTSTGLGGIDNKQVTQGLSGAGTLEPKQTKDHTLPDPIIQTLNEFQNFTKQQKSLSVEISHGSSKPLKKVQEDTEAMESLLTMITSGLTRNAIAVDKLKTETAQGLHQAEMAQRNHETPPGLDYDSSAPADYFNDLVTKFETDTVRLRVQIEASEKHLRSLTQSSTISPQELTLAMRRLHETLIVLAARVQALHTSVQSQKEQFKNLRRVYFKDDINIFENETDQNLVKKQTIYSLRSLTGPTPFSENLTGPALHVDGLAMLASSTCASVPTTTACAKGWISDLRGPMNNSNIRNSFQSINFPRLQLKSPPIGNKRSRH